MKIINVSPLPYIRTTDRSIRVNGESVSDAVDNIHEPGSWDICFYIAVKGNVYTHYYLVIDDNLYSFALEGYYRGEAIYRIQQMSHLDGIIDSFKALMAGEAT